MVIFRPWAGWTWRHTRLGDERKVDVLDGATAEGVVVLSDAGGEAVDVKSRVPARRVPAANNTAGRIELHFHERRSGVVADVVGFGRVRAVEDVGVAVWRASSAGIWVRLVVADCHADPECRMQLEVEYASRAILLGEFRRIFGKLKNVDAGISGAGYVRVEESRRLVMAGIGAVVAAIFILLGAEYPRWIIARDPLGAELGGSLS